MNNDWKSKYYFDDKTRVVESSSPSSIPCNVSPFVRKEEKTSDPIGKSGTGSAEKKKDSCSIA